MLKYIVFYFLFTAWFGYYNYVKYTSDSEPKTRKEKVIRKKINMVRERAISEVYIMEGGSREEIGTDIDKFVMWSSILLAWYTIPANLIRKIKRLIKRVIWRRQ